jgi:membrane protease YdiL (CAAX protease family)
MATNTGSGWKVSFRGVIALFILGMAGVVALAVYSVPSLRSIPELQATSLPLLLLIAATNSTILLAVFVLLGAGTAPRIGLRSHVYAWATGRNSGRDQFHESLRTAIGIGVVLFATVAVLDVFFAQFVQLETGTVVSDAQSLRTLAESIPMRLLYGGITEELLLRWGLMAPVAWVIWRGRAWLGASIDSPSEGTMWAAIAVSAVLFGVGHLPALAASFGLTPALVVRTVVLNAIAGFGFGWLFWRQSLETAMVAHMTFHVALVVVSTVLIVVT